MISALDSVTEQMTTALANAALANRNRFDFMIVTPSIWTHLRNDARCIGTISVVLADDVDTATRGERRLRYVAVLWAAITRLNRALFCSDEQVTQMLPMSTIAGMLFFGQTSPSLGSCGCGHAVAQAFGPLAAQPSSPQGSVADVPIPYLAPLEIG